MVASLKLPRNHEPKVGKTPPRLGDHRKRSPPPLMPLGGALQQHIEFLQITQLGRRLNGSLQIPPQLGRGDFWIVHQDLKRPVGVAKISLLQIFPRLLTAVSGQGGLSKQGRNPEAPAPTDGDGEQPEGGIAHEVSSLAVKIPASPLTISGPGQQISVYGGDPRGSKETGMPWKKFLLRRGTSQVDRFKGGLRRQFSHPD